MSEFQTEHDNNLISSVEQPTGAPQPDAAASTEPATQEKAVNSRDAVMRRIIENYEAGPRKAELELAETYKAEAHDRVEGLPLGTTTPSSLELDPSDKYPPHIDESKGEVAPSPTQLNPTQIDQSQPLAAPVRRKHNIDGQEVELSDAELLHLATLGGRALNVLRQQQQQPQPMPQRIQQQPQQQVVQQSQQPQQPPQFQFNEERAKELVHKLSYGSPEEATQAVMELQRSAAQAALAQANSQPRFDPNQFVAIASAQAEHRVIARMQLEQNLNVIGQEYSSIFNNPRRSELAALVLHEIRGRDMQLGRMRGDLECYREACNVVCQDLGIQPRQNAPTQQPQGNTPNQITVQASSRLERKRAAPVAPISATRVQHQQTQRAVTGSEIVNQMKRARGQLMA